MNRLPLHRLQKAGIFVALFALIAALYSCAGEAEVRASFEEKKIDETGQSALNYDYNPGWNAMLALFMGLSGAYGGANKSPDPSDYKSYNRAFSLNVGYSLDKIVKAIKGK